MEAQRLTLLTSMNPILSQFNPIHTNNSFFIKIHVNAILSFSHTYYVYDIF
jgi:hypothetical protein